MPSIADRAVLQSNGLNTLGRKNNQGMQWRNKYYFSRAKTHMTIFVNILLKFVWWAIGHVCVINMQQNSLTIKKFWHEQAAMDFILHTIESESRNGSRANQCRSTEHHNMPKFIILQSSVQTNLVYTLYSKHRQEKNCWLLTLHKSHHKSYLHNMDMRRRSYFYLYTHHVVE